MAGPLEGVRIIDMTHVILGPYCTQQLADLGADVIKIESPEGDVMRHVGPQRNAGMAPVFLHLNRNKRSIVLDLKQPAARTALHQLCIAADIFAVNMRADALQRMGVDYASLARANPGNMPTATHAASATARSVLTARLVRPRRPSFGLERPSSVALGFSVPGCMATVKPTTAGNGKSADAAR